MIDEKIDAVICGGNMLDLGFVVRKILGSILGLYAAPEYLE